MKPDQTPGIPETPGPADEVLAFQAEQLAALPFTLFSSWWTAMLGAWCPPSLPCASSEDCHELVVPEPIEEEGERSLFA